MVGVFVFVGVLVKLFVGVGVKVNVGVFVLVKVFVGVLVGVFVFVGVFVKLFVLVGVKVFVGVNVEVKQTTLVVTILESSGGKVTPVMAFPRFHWAWLGMVAGQVLTLAAQVTVTDCPGTTVPVFQVTAVPLELQPEPPVQLW